MQIFLRLIVRRHLYTIAIVLAATSQSFGGTARDEAIPWYAPSGIMFQTAGFMGFVCVGAEYLFLRDRLVSDVVYGFVPEGVAGKNHHIITLKSSLRPVRIDFSDTGHLFPFYFGVSMIYCPHKDTFLFLPDKYPDHYYKPTALHAVLNLGIELGWFNAQHRRYNSFYVEVCTLYIYLKTYAKNRSVIDFRDILSLALGYKIMI
ncbi:MAG TPA: hypothetical protein PK573_05935 [Spirochaetota bacterium]|nr:hypothetical protein [Spirochaetota bacterium]